MDEWRHWMGYYNGINEIVGTCGVDKICDTKKVTQTWVKDYMEPSNTLQVIIQIMKAAWDEPKIKIGIEVPTLVKHA